jgi:adenylate cyclase
MPFVLVDPNGNRLAALGEGGALVVGRSAECALALSDPTVSRRHAELVGAHDHLTVRDLGSRNGTFRNGVRVQTARLRAGDSVTFGVVTVRVARAAAALDEGGGPPSQLVAAPSDPALASPPSTPDSARRRGPPPRRAPDGDDDAPAAAAPNGDGEPSIVAERGAAAPHELTARRLALLLEATRALGGAADTAAVVARVVTAALRTLDADRAAVFRVVSGASGPTGTGVVMQPTEDELVTAAARDRWDADLTLPGTTPLPRSVARAALARRAAVLTLDAAADPRFTGQSVLRQRVRSALCAPLLAADGSPLGAVYVDSGDPARAFREEDLDFLTAFAGVAAAALENARLGERLRREAVSRENFARYFAAPVAARIAASDVPASPGGERRTVAVLFADLRGFTRFAASVPPDEVAETLSEFLSAMVDCVFRHGGTLDKFIGDCVMAQWGAPEAAPDDADRALAAALDMHHALEALNERRARVGRAPLAMGLGIAHGEVFAGNIGSERRLEFTVIGAAVNQASRLCDAAAAGEVLVSDALRRALRAPAAPMRVVPVPFAPGEPAPAAVYIVDRSPAPNDVFTPDGGTPGPDAQAPDREAPNAEAPDAEAPDGAAVHADAGAAPA